VLPLGISREGEYGAMSDTLTFHGIKAVVTDIEGTTSAISFVHDVLFPFAREALPDFIARRGQEPEVRTLLDDAKREAGDPSMSDDALAATLARWIDEDRKITPLKTLQGLIWEEGYQKGELTGHIYDDAAIALKRWAEEGVTLCVYSSGSVAAQKLIFGHSPFGNLASLFAGYFDTTTGPKKDPESYRRIAHVVGGQPSSILFLSDSADEIAAANEAGFKTVQLVREGEAQPVARGQPRASSFAEIALAR
jgi:enolase-phosphatase E1